MKNQLIALTAAIVMVMTAACNTGNSDETYVASVKGKYALVDDTIEIKQGILINRVGFRKIINGKLKDKEYKTKQWYLKSEDAPIFEKRDNELIIGTITYKKIRP
jgi:uncharacterized lipoprotein YehR (DUF1307 family)